MDAEARDLFQRVLIAEAEALTPEDEAPLIEVPDEDTAPAPVPDAERDAFADLMAWMRWA